MAIFNSYVKLPEGTVLNPWWRLVPHSPWHQRQDQGCPSPATRRSRRAGTEQFVSGALRLVLRDRHGYAGFTKTWGIDLQKSEEFMYELIMGLDAESAGPCRQQGERVRGGLTSNKGRKEKIGQARFEACDRVLGPSWREEKARFEATSF